MVLALCLLCPKSKYLIIYGDKLFLSIITVLSFNEDEDFCAFFCLYVIKELLL